jgi:hypothetical protein
VMDGCALFFSFCMPLFCFFARWISHHSLSPSHPGRRPSSLKCGATASSALCCSACMTALHACRPSSGCAYWYYWLVATALFPTACFP